MCEQQADWICYRIEIISIADHLLALREERRHGQKIRDDTNKDKLKELVKEFEILYLCIVLRTKNIGSWLTVRGTTVTCTVFVDKKFVVFMCLL